MEQEVWKDVAGYEGKYSVSSHGRVRSNFTISKLGKWRELGTILKFSINKRGYYTVKLINDGYEKTRKPHRLVCIAFHENPENKPQVNHKDCNQLNNHYTNLEWCTPKENTQHAHKNGRSKEYNDKIRKVTPEHERFIVANYGKLSTKEIAAKVGVAASIVIKYCHKNEVRVYRNQPKKVIDLITKKEFECTESAAASIGLEKRQLQRMLSGERENKTTFRYKYA